MKIAMIGQKRFPSREGGIDVVVEQLASRMVKQGNEVTLFVRKKKGYNPPKIFEGIRVVKVPTINKKATDALIYSFFASLKALFQKGDIIHFHAEGNCFFLWMTKFSKKRIVVTIHGLDWKRGKFKGLGAKILLKAEKRIVKFADEIIVLCKSDQQYFEQQYHRKTILIPNGFEKFNLCQPELITEKYGLEKERFLLFLARIVPEKGLHYLINAYKETNTAMKLVIAGGDSHSKEYYKEMLALAKECPNIIFTGFVQGKILEELYSNAYLSILPSDIEGMPMSLLEALGHERICLVSDIPENHIDEKNCYFFKKGDSISLQHELEKILIHKKAFSSDTPLMDWSEVTKKTLAVYKGEED